MANSFEEAWIKTDFFTCPVCGERFYMPPYVTDWTHKTKVKGHPVPVCSYKCYSKASKKTELKGEHYLNNANKWQKKNRLKRSGAE